MCAVVEVDRHLVEPVEPEPTLDRAQQLRGRQVRAIRYLDLPRAVQLDELHTEATEQLLCQRRRALDIRKLDADRRHRLLHLIGARPVAVHVQCRCRSSDRRRSLARYDDLVGERMYPAPLASGRSTEDLECLVRLEHEPLGEDAFGLLDHDSRPERLFELAVALRQQLHEGDQRGRRRGTTIGARAGRLRTVDSVRPRPGDGTHCRAPWSPITAATAPVNVGSMRKTRAKPVTSKTFKIRRSFETSTRPPPPASSRVSVFSRTPSTVESIKAAPAKSTTMRRAPAAVSSESPSSSCGAVKRST